MRTLTSDDIGCTVTGTWNRDRRWIMASEPIYAPGKVHPAAWAVHPEHGVRFIGIKSLCRVQPYIMLSCQRRPGRTSTTRAHRFLISEDGQRIIIASGCRFFDNYADATAHIRKRISERIPGSAIYREYQWSLDWLRMCRELGANYHRTLERTKRAKA